MQPLLWTCRSLRNLVKALARRGHEVCPTVVGDLLRGMGYSLQANSKPLRSYRTIVQLIAATTTDAGLTVRAELDENKYPKGLKVSDAQLGAVNLSRHSFHGDWNYTISPSRQNRPRQKSN
jgi:hypothetical protein